MSTAAIRVAHLTSVHPPDDVRVFFKECRSLAAAGYDVHLVAPGARASVVDGVELHGVERTQGGRIRRMTSTVFGVYRVARSLQARVYHLHDPELLPIGILLRLAGKVVVYDAHEHLPQQVLSKPWIPAAARRPLAALVELGERLGTRAVSAVVAAEPHVGDRLGRSARRAITVRNYPAEGELAPRAWDEKAREVCYVGSITEIRGAREMVRAIARTDATLMLGGDFTPPALREELAGEPGWSQVTAPGRIGRRELAEIVSRARAGLVVLKPVPKYLEATPTKMFEYMAAGIPVIASDFPAWREIVDSHACGVCVDPEDPAAIADSIQRIVDDPAAAQRMGENGRLAVERLYGWGPERDRLLALYEELTGPR